MFARKKTENNFRFVLATDSKYQEKWLKHEQVIHRKQKGDCLVKEHSKETIVWDNNETQKPACKKLARKIPLPSIATKVNKGGHVTRKNVLLAVTRYKPRFPNRRFLLYRQCSQGILFIKFEAFIAAEFRNCVRITEAR